MRFSLGFALAFAAVSARAQTSPADALRRALHDTTLENGLTVVAVENHAVPLVTIDITFKTGAFTQEPGDEGVPHLFEHMLFKSYIDDSRATWPMEAGRLDAEYNGTTSDERSTTGCFCRRRISTMPWAMSPSSCAIRSSRRTI